MRIEGTLDNMRIVGPSMRPYTARDFTVCPACGASAHGWWRRALRKIKGKRDEPVVNMRYCQGDKPPTEKLLGLAMILSFSGETVNGCAGIPDPHLHCTCKCCDAKWYTALKESL